jgi:transcription antitermination protein NusB
MAKTDNALRAAAQAASRPEEPAPAKQRGGGSAKARRKASRLAAVQALYQIELAGTNPETVLGEFIQHRIGQEIDGDRYVAAEPQLFADIVRGTSARRAEVDRMVEAGLDPQWPLERLELLMRAILRAGALELLVHTDTHARILISEYVDVCHAFFAGKEPGMVNGVLDGIARSLRPEEVNSAAEGRGGPGKK